MRTSLWGKDGPITCLVSVTRCKWQAHKSQKLLVLTFHNHLWFGSKVVKSRSQSSIHGKVCENIPKLHAVAKGPPLSPVPLHTVSFMSN